MRHVKSRAFSDTPVTEAALMKAMERGKTARSARAVFVGYEKDKKAIRFKFEDDMEIVLPTCLFSELNGFSAAELMHVSLTPAGTTVQIRGKDVDVSILGLLADAPVFGALANHVAAVRNGRTLSSAKAAAARENGKRGGRPPRPREA